MEPQGLEGSDQSGVLPWPDSRPSRGPSGLAALLKQTVGIPTGDGGAWPRMLAVKGVSCT